MTIGFGSKSAKSILLVLKSILTIVACSVILLGITLTHILIHYLYIFIYIYLYIYICVYLRALVDDLTDLRSKLSRKSLT